MACAAAHEYACLFGPAPSSRDRAFLDRCVTRVLELRLPDHDAVEHAGGWTDFVASRELARRQGRYALETMCIGGGQGLAAVFERA